MKKRIEYSCTALGDSCLIFKFFDKITAHGSDFILSIYKNLKGCDEFLDIVPSYTDIAVYFDPVKLTRSFIEERMESALSGSSGVRIQSNQYTFPVLYDGDDLSRVSILKNIEIKEIVSQHTQADYTVAMIGFQPHFPYLIGLPECLETARLDKPRKKVPAGSVAIGGAQAGVYPSESPGGWNLIGRMDPEKLKVLKPCDRANFYEVQNEDQL